MLTLLTGTFFAVRTVFVSVMCGHFCLWLSQWSVSYGRLKFSLIIFLQPRQITLSDSTLSVHGSLSRVSSRMTEVLLVARDVETLAFFFNVKASVSVSYPSSRLSSCFRFILLYVFSCRIFNKSDKTYFVVIGLILFTGAAAAGGFTRGPSPIGTVSVLTSISDHPSFGSSLSVTRTGCAARLILHLQSVTEL
jgi:hypothetical protein